MKKFKELSGVWKAVIILWSIVIILAIVLFATIGGSDDTDDSSTTVSKTELQMSSDVKLLMDNAKLTEDEAKIILKDLKTVGAGKIGYCKLITDGPDKGFEVEDDNYKFTLTTKDGKTDTIYCGKILLFNYEGGALDTITNYHLTFAEKVQFKAAAKEYVKNSLKAPTTAEFNEELRVVRKHDVVTVQSSVDSQNSFGAMLRSSFSVQMSYSSKDMTLLYLEIDGEPLYGKPVK